MSEREYAVYQFVVRYVKENLYPPSMAEICKNTGIKSKSTVSDTLSNLESLGYITVKLGTPRAIRLEGFSIVSTAC